MKKNLKIPRELLEQKPYSNLSNQAKILYAVLLDLKEQAAKNNWIDDRGYRYVLFPKKNMQKFFNCSRYVADKFTRELEVMGLIRFDYERTPYFERRIYVRSFGPSTDFVSLRNESSDKEDGSANTSRPNTDGHKDNGRPGNKADVIRLTLKNIRLMTCVLEEMIGEVNDSKE